MCGIVGIKSNSEVNRELIDSLIHLQHRGQDASGLITADDRFHIKRQFGLVREAFNNLDPKLLPGTMGLGHVRYPTSGMQDENEIQPFWSGAPYGLSIAHNGNLTETDKLKERLAKHHNYHLNTKSDSELLLHFFAAQLALKNHLECPFFEKLALSIQELFSILSGAYSVVSCIIGQGLAAFRDPNGIRPLVIGRRAHSQNRFDYIFASENTMFYQLGFEEMGDVAPGELVFVDNDQQLHRRQLIKAEFNPCIFEYVYFARPDARLNDVSVYRSRLRMGQNLALKWQSSYPEITPDVVIPVPFSSNTAALSFASTLGIRYTEGLYKNPFIGRTFIMKNQKTRQSSVRYKLSPQETEIRNKKVLLLDDSIVRGTTSKEIVRMVKEFGAREVYFASACPPVAHPCFYGINLPSQDELIAAKLSKEAIKEYLGVDALLYQTEQDLIEAVTRKGSHQIQKPCIACLNGKLPTSELKTNL
jgi:amidophosphoribosyltransferase